MLKLTTEVGRRAREVKEDMVMARGIGGSEREGDGWVEVQTTTECVRRRITVRNCSGRGGVVVGSVEEWGWIVGG
jgi:hypothetical protein